MPKVFVVNDTGHDYTAAKDFGDSIIMTEGIVNKFRLSEMFRMFQEFLKTSSADDFILQSGPSIMNIVACSIFVALHERLNLLIWRSDGKGNDGYVLRKLNFSLLKGVKKDGKA